MQTRIRLPASKEGGGEEVEHQWNDTHNWYVHWVDQVERYLKILMPLYSKVLGLAVIAPCWDVRYGTIPKLRRFP
jgi:hypothetical protein